MSHWQLLAIEPTSDKKTIKRAYAKLLKKTRPDQDPEAFSALHNAYQVALDEAASGKTDSTEANTVTELSTHQVQEESSTEPTSRGFAFVSIAKDQQENAFKALDNDIEALTNNTCEYFRITVWRSLFSKRSSTEPLTDLAYKLSTGFWLFGWASTLYYQNRALPRHVLRYLSEIFNWSGQTQALERQFGRHSVVNLFDYMHETVVVEPEPGHQPTVPPESYHLHSEPINTLGSVPFSTRLKAIACDNMIVFSIVGVLWGLILLLNATFSHDILVVRATVLTATIVLLCTPLFIYLNPHSPGYKKQGIIMVNNKNKPLTILGHLMRLVAVWIASVFLAVILSLKIAILLPFILIFMLFLHDYLLKISVIYYQ